MFHVFLILPRLLWLFTFLSARYLLRRGEKLAQKIAQLNTNTSGAIVAHIACSIEKEFFLITVVLPKSVRPVLREEKRFGPVASFQIQLRPGKERFCWLSVSSRGGNFCESLASRRKFNSEVKWTRNIFFVESYFVVNTWRSIRRKLPSISDYLARVFSSPTK